MAAAPHSDSPSRRPRRCWGPGDTEEVGANRPRRAPRSPLSPHPRSGEKSRRTEEGGFFAASPQILPSQSRAAEGGQDTEQAGLISPITKPARPVCKLAAQHCLEVPLHREGVAAAPLPLPQVPLAVLARAGVQGRGQWAGWGRDLGEVPPLGHQPSARPRGGRREREARLRAPDGGGPPVLEWAWKAVRGI